MTSPYTATFGGNSIYPSQVTYNALNVSIAQVYQLQWPLENNTLSNSGTLGASLIFATITDINTTIGGAAVGLPDTALAGYGSSITLNNIGSFSFDVHNLAGTTIATIAPGAVYIIYATPMAANLWYAFQMGAAISAPSAAALAGTGLISVGGLLTQNIPVVISNTTPYTFGAPDLAKLYSWTGGAGNWILPSSVAVGNGFYVQIKNNGSGQLSVTPNGSDLINGVNSAQAYNPGDSSFMVADGLGGWEPLGFGNVSNNVFQFLAISLAGLSGTYTLSGSALNKIAYRFTGALAGNIQIVVPNTVQQYWVDNETSGGFTLSVGTSGQVGPPTVATGSRIIFYSDGTNVVNASTGGISLPVIIAQGGTGSTTAGGALTNLGGTSIGTAVFTASTVAVAQAALKVLDAATSTAISVALG